MEEPKDINNSLDELFAKARSGKPVMGVDEVRNLIATAPVASASNSGNSAKSNSTLYMLLGGIAIIAITAGIWFYMKSDNQPVAVSQTATVPSNVENNKPSNTSSEIDQQALQTNSSNDAAVNNETSAGDNKQDNTDVPSKSNNELAVKSKPASAEKVNPAESNPDPSKTKTTLVTGGDFEVKFQTEDKVVKMKLKEEEVKELNINGKVIADNEYPKYKDVIEQGKKMMAAEKLKNPSNASSAKTPEEQKRDEANTRLFNAFTDQLKKDKLINEDKYSFKLTSSELLIDGKPQPDAVRQKYLDLFKSTAGRDLGGTTFKFDHGMN
ncbi:MAG: hypothetical protein ABI723_10890 [Bacteroidia bacterium]